MAQATVSDVISRIKAGIKKSASGRPIRSFNRQDFDDLAKAILNDAEYKSEIQVIRRGKIETVVVEPTKLYRTALRTILDDFGVDKQESASILNDYRIRDVKGLYEIASEIIYQYMGAGKAFTLPTRADFKGSFVLNEIAENVSTHRNPQTGEPIQVANKAHKRLGSRSSTPNWLKSRVNDKSAKK